jgi:hypothetical protein
LSSFGSGSVEDVKMLAPNYRNTLLVLVPLEMSGADGGPRRRGTEPGF